MNTYLQKLTYNAQQFSQGLRSYITNMRLVMLLLIGLILGGISSYATLPRTLMPEIGITVVTVQTILPGASPEDIESIITDPLESELLSIDGIDTITSSSRESMSLIVMQFDDGVDRNRALSDAQSSVNRVPNLPSDATDPLVDVVNFEDTPFVQYAITGRTDAASLNRFTQKVKDELENSVRIDRVVVSGLEEREVQIIIESETLRSLGLNPLSVARTLLVSFSSYPSGIVYADGLEFGISIDRGVMSLDDLRRLPLSIQGESYQLSDLARVVEGSVPGFAPAYITQVEGDTRVTSQAVTLSIYRTLDTKIADAESDVAQVIQSQVEQVDGKFTFEEITNVSKDIDEQFQSLLRNLGITVALVFLTLLLFLGLRQAIVSAISIPLVFMAAFIVMQVVGISLNFLSVFSLLLSLGLLVDVTIVIVSAITSYYRTGKFTPKEAGLLVWKDFFVTLFITTLTTVWAFLPLLLASGMIGEFIKPIPVIVSSMLLSSVVIGFVIILPLMVWLLQPSAPRRVRIFFSITGLVLLGFVIHSMVSQWAVGGFLRLVGVLVGVGVVLSGGIVLGKGIGYLRVRLQNKFSTTQIHDTAPVDHEGIINVRFIEVFYRRVLNKILEKSRTRKKVVTIVLVFFIFSFALLPLGFVKNEFFPGEDVDVLYVSIELPQGTNPQATSEVAKDFVEHLLFDDVDIIQTQIGVSIGDQGDFAQSGNNMILYTLRLLPKESREMTSMEIAQRIRGLEVVETYDRGVVRVREFSGGPPAGADITISFLGEELEQLDLLAQQLIEHLQNTEGVVNIEKSITDGTAKVVFEPDNTVLAHYNLTRADVSTYLRLFASGISVDESVRFEDLEDERDVVLRTNVSMQDLDTLQQISIPLSDGSVVPLNMLGSFHLKTNPTTLTHEEGERVLTVTAGVEGGFNAQEINTAIKIFVENEMSVPRGYVWETGGANEENEKSVQSILQAMLLAVILIFITLVVQLGSYRKSLIVLFVIPLAISGVFVVFAFAGIPLSFPALIGTLALFGIVINNSIIIIDQINRNRSQRIGFHESVLDGATSRLEPIMLSSLTTIIGLLPITITEPVWRGLGGAIIAGLLFSGLIMLFFIPTVYYMWFEKEEEEDFTAIDK